MYRRNDFPARRIVGRDDVGKRLDRIMGGQNHLREGGGKNRLESLWEALSDLHPHWRFMVRERLGVTKQG